MSEHETNDPKIRLANLEKDKRRLLEFVRAFLGNFQECGYCDGKGKLADWLDCTVCMGTGRRIISIGMLYAELPEEARALLERMEGTP